MLSGAPYPPGISGESQPACLDRRISLLAMLADEIDALLDFRHAVVPVDRLARMTGYGAKDGELLSQWSDDLQLARVHGGNCIQAELLGDLENFPPLGSILAVDDAIVDRLNSMFLELHLVFGDHFVA